MCPGHRRAVRLAGRRHREGDVAIFTDCRRSPLDVVLTVVVVTLGIDHRIAKVGTAARTSVVGARVGGSCVGYGARGWVDGDDIRSTVSVCSSSDGAARR